MFNKIVVIILISSLITFILYTIYIINEKKEWQKTIWSKIILGIGLLSYISLVGSVISLLIMSLLN